MEQTTKARNLLMYTGSQFGEIEELDDIAGTCGIQVFDGSEIKPTEKVAFLENNNRRTPSEKIETYFLSLRLGENNPSHYKVNFIYKDSLLQNEQLFLNESQKYLTIGDIPKRDIWTTKSWDYSKTFSINSAKQLMGKAAYKCIAIDDPKYPGGNYTPKNPNGDNDDGKDVYAIHNHNINGQTFNFTVTGNIVGDLNYGLSQDGVQSLICKNAIMPRTLQSFEINDPIMMMEFKSKRLNHILKDADLADNGILTIGNNSFGEKPKLSYKDIITDGQLRETSPAENLSFLVGDRASDPHHLVYDNYTIVSVDKNYCHKHTFKFGAKLESYGTKTENSVTFDKGSAPNKIATKLLTKQIKFIPIGSIYFGENQEYDKILNLTSGSIEPSKTTSISNTFIEPTQKVLYKYLYNVNIFKSDLSGEGTDNSDMEFITETAWWHSLIWYNYNNGVDTDNPQYQKSHNHTSTGADIERNETFNNYFKSFSANACEKLFWD